MGRSRSTVAIGICGGYHDSSAAIVADGRLVAAAEEERFTRRKNESAMPLNAYRFCLEQAGLTPADVDVLAFYQHPRSMLERQIWFRGMREQDIDRGRRVEATVRRGFGVDDVRFFRHHETHAASAYYLSGFDDAALINFDGVGEWDAMTSGIGTGLDIKLTDSAAFPHSVSFLYSAVTEYLGFRWNSDEYKVMGLASFGTPSMLDAVRRMCTRTSTGHFRLRGRYFDFMPNRPLYRAPAFEETVGFSPRRRDEPLATKHADLAASVQALLEDELLRTAELVYRRSGRRRVAYAGGMALNCVANARLIADGPFAEVFVPPAPGDSGTSVGAAALAWTRLTGRTLRPEESIAHTAHLGPGFGASEIDRVLDDLGVGGRLLARAEIARDVAERLEHGHVVALVDGRMELGPRALGARSILADPRRQDMKDHINATIKGREPFRPFAPVVIEDRAGELFDDPRPSPFMSATVQVHREDTIPAVTHVDGGSRVQTLPRDSSLLLRDILVAFETRTDMPALMNTSFNTADEPIVCTPEDAVLTFGRCGADVLVIGHRLIEKDDLPEWLVRYARERPLRALAGAR